MFEWGTTCLLINSKKHLAVASTSIDASWAPSKSDSNNLKWSSVNEGHLNPPPLPPGISQYWVDTIFVSSVGFDCK